jgi:hypothetical protein
VLLLLLLLLLPQGITYAESTGHFLAIEEVRYHENAHTQPATVAAPLNEKHSVQPQPAMLCCCCCCRRASHMLNLLATS